MIGNSSFVFFFFLFRFFIIHIFCSNYARVLCHKCPFVQEYSLYLALGLYYLPAVGYEYTKHCL